MNQYTKPEQFMMKAIEILESFQLAGNEALADLRQCFIHNGVLYEDLGSSYRFFFSDDDYDYVEDCQKTLELDVLRGK